MNRVCLDANVWIKVLTEEPDSHLAIRLVTQLFNEHKEIVAPAIMRVEVGSILRKKWSRKLISNEQLQQLWRYYNSLPVQYSENTELYDTAWRIADTNRLIHLYDAVYLAVSDHMEFWTADERLVRSVSQASVRIRLLAELGSDAQ